MKEFLWEIVVPVLLLAGIGFCFVSGMAGLLGAGWWLK